MPVPSPFHERTSKLCTSMRWKEWAGHYAVCSYDTCHDREYFALRHAAGLIDVSPLFKYEIHGKDAARFLSRLTVKDPGKLKPHQVTYLCWCDDEGKVIDDGTVTRLEEEYFRVTAAEPSFSWFTRHARGFEVEIDDSTEKIASLALQGPNAREILKAASTADLDSLKFFRGTYGELDGADVYITRTGYTGDLGYEIWIDRSDALKLWDSLIEHGTPYGIEPAGLDALDVARLEAGFIMNGVDYFSANHCPIESRKSSPFEIGLGWTVQLDRDPFFGQKALRREKQNGSAWSLAGIEVDWDEMERLFSQHDLPPQLPHGAWRTPIPIYNAGNDQIGHATSGTWSPTLKKNLALATLRTPYAKLGKELRFEMTAEFQRKTVAARVVPIPFFNPERKKSVPHG